jgi:hypothetical protein
MALARGIGRPWARGMALARMMARVMARAGAGLMPLARGVMALAGLMALARVGGMALARAGLMALARGIGRPWARVMANQKDLYAY